MARFPLSNHLGQQFFFLQAFLHPRYNPIFLMAQILPRNTFKFSFAKNKKVFTPKPNKKKYLMVLNRDYELNILT